jgi:hypothetical protein
MEGMEPDRSWLHRLMDYSLEHRLCGKRRASFLGPEVDNVLSAIAKRKDWLCPERLTPSARQFQRKVCDKVANISSLPSTLSGQIQKSHLTLAKGFGAEGESDGLLNPAASSQGLDPATESPPPETSPFEIGVELRMRFRLI